jgi:hypothetical protein
MTQTIVRWFLAIVLVSLPLSYLLWQWRYADHKELSNLSFDAFNERVSNADAPVFWAYAIYLLALTTVVVCAVALIAAGLGRVFPSPKKPASKD